MFRLSVKSEFSAAHSLRGYKGKCESLHGHNWKVETVVISERLSQQGMVLDFQEIKKLLKEVLETLDHKHLNELEYFKKVNPTSENLAGYIFNNLSRKLKAAGCRLKEITVWESDNCSATYSK